MKRIRSYLSSRFGFSVTVNAVTLLVSCFLFRPFWEENDDIWIALLAEGALGKHEPHVLFSNIFYGNILCTFQKIIPAVRWHAVFEFLFAIVIAVAFVYVLSGDKKGRIISVIFLLACQYEIFVAVQFSKIPAFIAVSGYMILFFLSDDEKLQKRQRTALCITAWVCLFYAMILRSESFLLATMVAGIYGVIYVFARIRKGTFGAWLKRGCICFLPVAALFLICMFADRMGYSDEGWGSFREYQDLESDMIDYHYDALMYSDHAEELDAIGVSENDSFMFLTWQFADDNYLTPELINKIIAIEPKGLSSVNIDLLKAWVANLYETVCVMNPVVIGLLIVLAMYIAFAFSGEDKIYRILLMLFEGGVSTVVLFYYQYSGRWSHRIVFALLLSQFVLFIYLLEKEVHIKPDRLIVTCVTVLLLFAVMTQRLGNEFDYQDHKRNTDQFPEAISFMMQNKDKLFVADTFSVQGYDKYNIFRAATVGQFDNYVTVGGAYVNSPATKTVTEKFGYGNPFEALEDRNDNVILIDNNCPDRKVLYCNEHGDGGTYLLESYTTAGGLDMYRIR